MALFGGNSDPTELAASLPSLCTTSSEPSQGRPRALSSARRQPPSPPIAEDSGKNPAEATMVPSPRAAPPPRLAATLQPVRGGRPLTPYAPAARRRVHAPSPLQQAEASSFAAALQTQKKVLAEEVRALQPTPCTAEGTQDCSGRKRSGEEQDLSCDSRCFGTAARRRVHPRSPLQEQEASPSAAALQPQQKAHAEEVRALHQTPYTAEGTLASGRKRRGKEQDVPCDSNKRPFQIGDQYVPSPWRTHASDPLEPWVQMSMAAFATNNPRDLHIIRSALLALPKGPISILHGDRYPIGDGGTAAIVDEGEIRVGKSAPSMPIEVHAYDVVGPDLPLYGYILSKPWRQFWEQNELVLHDTDIMLATKSFRGHINRLQRISTILQGHPGPVRCFRVDSSRLENDTEQLEAWFELLKVKRVEQVVFVNCKWPQSVTDFPINSLDCESLKQLNLCFVNMSGICLNYVDNLKKIDLTCCCMSTLDLYTLVYQCASLIELSIGIYEGQVIRLNSASLETLHIWQTTTKTLEVQNAAKLQRVSVEAQPWKSAEVSVGLQRPPPRVGIWITNSLVLAEACFNISTQSITINNISTMKDNVPLPTLKRLTLHICLRAKKEKTAFLNLMKSCLTLEELTLWRDDEAYGEEYFDSLYDDWTATLKNLSCLLHLQSFTIKDYKGGYTELAIASAVLEYAPSLDQLIFEANVSDDLIFSGAKTKLGEIAPASANASVRYIIGLHESNSFFSDGG